MINNRALIWALPLVVAIVGSLFLLFGYWDYKREKQDTEKLFRAHVDSVALLVKEGAREAAASTSLIYDLAEQNLSWALRLIEAASPDRLPEELAVRLVSDESGRLTGHWGSVDERSKKIFTEWMMQAPRHLLIDDGPIAELGLACIAGARSPDAPAGPVSVVCRDARDLEALRQEVGIGPLLKGVIQQDVRYVALQDEEGILAVAPSPSLISSWRDDPFLAKALAADPSGGISRLREVQGRTVFEGLIPFEMADGSTVMLRVGIDGTVLGNIEDASESRYIALWVLVISMILMSAIISVFVRHSERRKAELDRMMRAQEENRKHWEAIGQMAATVAHEVRNPLNTIGMVSQRLKAEVTLPETERSEFDEMTDILRSESERVARVVTDFLDLGKPLRLLPQSVDAAGTVDDAVLPSQIRAQKEGKRFELDNKCSGTLSLDAGRLRQVMSNLLDNALDAAADGGKVAVFAETKDDGLTVRISDNGSGLTPEQQAEVLKPFVSFKAKGTGLGLPLVKRVVEAQGGILSFSSVVGEGTTVSFFIPEQPKEK
jgi:signal transduction histidine kinase